MAKKKVGKVQERVTRLLMLHLVRKYIAREEREKALRLAAEGKKRGLLAAMIPPPGLILYQLAGGRPLKVKVKTGKNQEGLPTVKKVSVVRRRKGLKLLAAGLVLKGLTKKSRRKVFGIF